MSKPETVGTFFGAARQERVDRYKRLDESTRGLVGSFALDVQAELKAGAQDRKDLESLMLYVDEAKNAAQLGGRVTGEPLANFIKRMVEESGYE